jgi:gas vesicle protein
MSNGGNVLLGVLAGAAAGVIAGVLIAPASGEETRENLSKQSEELLNNVKDLIDKEKEAVKSSVKNTVKGKE